LRGPEDVRILLRMKCYYVLVHGRLDWSVASPSPDGDEETSRPEGFYCHRYVLASSIHHAQQAAFRRVRENLDKQTGWITGRGVELVIEAEETTSAPISNLLERDNPGHIFYDQE
jgi:hypothetical protein